MSLNVALEFASCGYVVLPVGPDKRPWIAHAVHSASTDPHTILRWSWTGAACAVATGERMEVLDVDVRGAGGALPLGAQGNPPACEGGIDGFTTLNALVAQAGSSHGHSKRHRGSNTLIDLLMRKIASTVPNSLRS